MARVATLAFARQIEALFDSGSVVGLSDRELLDRFLTRQHTEAEAAFAAIVSRHGPMVLKVCVQLLRDRHHAEDAFQAVFLVLARKAGSIQNPDKLSNWLYGVALRTARYARPQIDRRRDREGGDLAQVEATSRSPDQIMIEREQAERVHTELARLPERFRLPILLCDLEGLSLDAAASRLECPPGTLRSRLARAREKLKARLTRRGLAFSSTALVAMLTDHPASAHLPTQLCHTTARAALHYTTGHAAGGLLSTSAVLIAQQVVKAAVVQVCKAATICLVAMGAVAAGVSYASHRNVPTKGDPVQAAAPKAPAQERHPKPDPVLAAAAQPAIANSKQGKPDRVIVTARVLTPDGKPMKAAAVDIVSTSAAAPIGASLDEYPIRLMGQGETDQDGRIRLDVPRVSSTSVHMFVAIAAAPGFGLNWAKLNPDAEEPTAEIRLEPEQIVRARLVDVSGLPAAGLEVILSGIITDTRRATWDGLHFWQTLPTGLRAWPRLMTDSQGQLRINGIGPNVSINLNVRDIRFARQDLLIKAAETSSPKDKVTTLALEPARIIEGRVLAADTGLPIPSAIISATTRLHNEMANGFMSAKFTADAQGHFQVNPIAGESYTLAAYPTGGEPYLIFDEDVPLPKGAIKVKHDLKLPRGVLIKGKVTEAGTGRPLAGASIQYISASDQFIGADNRRRIIAGWQAIVASQQDGSFQIAVLPGKGHLLVFGPTPDFVLEEIGSNRLYSDKPGGQRNYAHKIIAYDTRPASEPLALNAELRRTASIKGRVEGPQGQTVSDGFLLTTLYITATDPSWRGDARVKIHDGRFELNGLAPDAKTRVSILDPEHEWGTTLDISGKQADQALLIKLEPCGQAKMRFVGPDGRPLANHRPFIEFVARTGPSRFSQKPEDRGQFTAEAEYLANVDRKHYGGLPQTSTDGRISLPALIPGALYRISDFSTANDPKKGPQIRKDFTVKPGQSLDLGDILIEKPERQ